MCHLVAVPKFASPQAGTQLTSDVCPFISAVFFWHPVQRDFYAAWIEVAVFTICESLLPEQFAQSFGGAVMRQVVGPVTPTLYDASGGMRLPPCIPVAQGPRYAVVFIAHIRTDGHKPRVIRVDSPLIQSLSSSVRYPCCSAHSNHAFLSTARRPRACPAVGSTPVNLIRAGDHHLG